MAQVVTIDAGTTGVRALAVDEAGLVTAVAYRELTQHFPKPGWVEHDATEIWKLVVEVLGELATLTPGVPVAAIGITNQRETAVTWNRESGVPLHRAIVWQDRRTTATCEALEAAGHLPLVRGTTGLVLDPYFTASKLGWLVAEGVDLASPSSAAGTVDSWVLWNLTGGTRGGVLATDPSNAARTALYDINAGTWSKEMLGLFGVPEGLLGEVLPSSGRFGEVHADLPEVYAGVPVSGIAGDQQSALFGQVCLQPGMVKATYGTGSFVLANAGTTNPGPHEGLVTTIAWDLGNGPVYALEGSAFVAGAAIQWLRDELGVIANAADLGPLAASVPDSGGVAIVPAFTGLGSPWWNPRARGVITGITRGAGRAQIARATVEALAFQVRAMVDAMATAMRSKPVELRADGGAAAMDLLLELEAAQLKVPVVRPRSVETTALGAAYLAGLAEGVWAEADLATLWQAEATFAPSGDETLDLLADLSYDTWLRSVERAKDWEQA